MKGGILRMHAAGEKLTELRTFEKMERRWVMMTV